jgi:hypothetical protein
MIEQATFIYRNARTSPPRVAPGGTYRQIDQREREGMATGASESQPSASPRQFTLALVIVKA